ncbi:hypothetical protein PUN28_017061 [Cardiocondyla obscurior]|uniref:Uncharacterized protein n=1 Tax=Cardiocondyla obscurior TaxID=286306 RepID=A0AAW2ELE4_9HYME
MTDRSILPVEQQCGNANRLVSIRPFLASLPLFADYLVQIVQGFFRLEHTCCQHKYSLLHSELASFFDSSKNYFNLLKKNCFTRKKNQED